MAGVWGTRFEIYIEEDGSWPIRYNGTSLAGARKAFLKAWKIKRLPAGSWIYDTLAPKLRGVIPGPKDAVRRRK